MPHPLTSAALLLHTQYNGGEGQSAMPTPLQVWVACRGEAKAAGKDYIDECQEKVRGKGGKLDPGEGAGGGGGQGAARVALGGLVGGWVGEGREGAEGNSS